MTKRMYVDAAPVDIAELDLPIGMGPSASDLQHKGPARLRGWKKLIKPISIKFKQGGEASTGLGLFITRQIVQLHRGKR